MSTVTSKNGAPDKVYDVMDHAGTIVATQTWSMHRDFSVFPFPDTFLPDPWLKSSYTSNHLSTMATYIMMMPLELVRECAGIIILL